jgi:hypothetical protein
MTYAYRIKSAIRGLRLKMFLKHRQKINKKINKIERA